MSSPPPAVTAPDVEQVAVDYLRPLLDSSTTVGTEWPEHLAESLPVVAVSLGGGGARLRGVTADRTLDIDVLAVTKADARDLAAMVSALLIAAHGTTQSGAQIYETDETSLIWLPDPVTRTPRYVLVMSIVIRLA